MAERRVTVEAAGGLHARVAARFVHTASKAPGEARVGRSGGEPGRRGSGVLV
ncbi:MAG: HPr family phosphocarrier protein [Streptosporangiaceae bacterium]